MGNLQNLVENTKDYLGNDYPKFVELMKMGTFRMVRKS